MAGLLLRRQGEKPMTNPAERMANITGANIAPGEVVEELQAENIALKAEVAALREALREIADNEDSDLQGADSPWANVARSLARALLSREPSTEEAK